MKQRGLNITPESKRKEILYIKRAAAFGTDSGIDILAFEAGVEENFRQKLCTVHRP